MKVVHSTEGASFSVNLLATDQAQAMIGAHAAALDSSFRKVEMSEAMRRRLHRSDYIFSGMKVFHEMNEAFPALVGSDGNIKPFEQFYKEVSAIHDRYNRHYLRAEYNFVHASAQMAARWEEFAADGDDYNLQYRTAGDNRVREEHRALDGVTLPFSDPFWEEFLPPNGWNCRCSVVQVRKSKYPVTDAADARRRGEQALQHDTRGMFRFNPGAQQKTVPDYNPYTISACRSCPVAKGKSELAKSDIPQNEACSACRWLRKCGFVDSETKKGNKIPPEEINAILALPYDEQFTVKYEGKKGKVYQHLLHCTAGSDNSFVQDVAKAYADSEGNCWINPIIRFDSPFRASYYKNLPAGSRCNPDLTTESYGYVDVKSPEKEPKMARNAINASKNQHSCACITDHKLKISIKTAHRRTNLLFNDPNYSHDFIFWYIDGKLIKYKRP